MALPVADFNRPVPADLFGGDPAGWDWPGFVQANAQAAATWCEGLAPVASHLPVGTKRLNAGDIERWDGAVWQVVELNYLRASGGGTGLGIPAGTLDSPGLYVFGDTDTGLYSSNVDNIALVTGGVNRLMADSQGRVGIGRAPLQVLDAQGPGPAVIRIRGVGGGGFFVAKSDSDSSFMAMGDAAVVTGGATNTTAAIWSAGSVPLVFLPGGAERWRMDAAGLLKGTGTAWIVSGSDTGIIGIVGGSDAVDDTARVTCYGRSAGSYPRTTFIHGRPIILMDTVSTTERMRIDAGLVTFAPDVRIKSSNSQYGGILYLGADSWNVTRGSTIGSVAVSDGNLHVDSGTTKKTYINFVSGNGVIFGNGANGNVAEISPTGVGTFAGLTVAGNGVWHGGNMASPSVSPGGNTLVQRDPSGYTMCYYINSTSPVSENPPISQVIVTNSGDNFFRKASLAHVLASLPSAVKAFATWNSAFTVMSSFNVSSISRVNQGQYAVNFTSAMPDVYSAIAGSRDFVAGDATNVAAQVGNSAQTVNTARVFFLTNTAQGADPGTGIIRVAFIR